MSTRRRMVMAAENITSKGVIDGVIQDDWPEIIKICQAGKAEEFYSVGDHAEITCHDQTFYMDYVGSGLDQRADKRDKPVSTWLARTALPSREWLLVYGAWGEPYPTIRQYCNEYLYSGFPANVQDAIVEVIKDNSDSSSSASRKQTRDKVWIPSYAELWTDGLYIEAIKSGKISRAKEASYWTRTSKATYRIYTFTGTGTSTSEVVNDGKVYNGVVPGFCL